MVRTHDTDEACDAVAEIIADQIERSNLDVMQKPPTPPHIAP